MEGRPVTIRFDKRACLLALSSLVLVHTTSLSAASPVLLLGEIRVLSHKAPSDPENFRSLVQKSFRTLVVPDRRDKKSYVLSAAGVIRATTSGSVKILETDRPTPSDDLAAMRVAVERALGRVREALL